MQMPLISWGAELAINQWAAFAATRATSGKLKLETADWPRTEPKISSSKPAAEGLRTRSSRWSGLPYSMVYSPPGWDHECSLNLGAQSGKSIEG